MADYAFTSVAGTATGPRTSPTPTAAPPDRRPSTMTEWATPPPATAPTSRTQPVPRPRAAPRSTPRPVSTRTSRGDFSVTAARRYALGRLGSRQFACLDTLVQRESGWRVTATNKSSGAYGLPQALPGSKMGKYGSDWKTNATTQLRWMIAYVNGRYGSACQALSHAQRTGWY